LRIFGGLGFNLFFRGSRGFVRTRNFALRVRSALVFVGDDGPFFNFPAFRERGKRG
jgi:hypothetical protein